ncbi:hypothetical protein OESDEN_04016 [Oesophagostomum dentatum]|uniref:Serine carboxypeptidase S28 n=1 Tax=Oesophagostomum dentatum TaxID=61180 RepID=A0A0B1TIV3_OESDE|nr:hypothetical protein OESDEN_04016 [Oesophagostomum dentatum]
MAYDQEKLAVVGWAQSFGAALFVLEHRFYGESQPKPDQSVENLKYLSSRQALGDIAEFIIGMNKLYGLHNPKWVTFGKSYAGGFCLLSLWVRQEYPDLIAGAVAFLAFQEMGEARFESESEKCAASIRRAFEDASEMMKSFAGRVQLKELFKFVSRCFTF